LSNLIGAERSERVLRDIGIYSNLRVGLEGTLPIRNLEIMFPTVPLTESYSIPLLPLDSM